MNTELLGRIQQPHIKKSVSNFKVGDTVAVDTLIREGDKARVQTFKGLVISTRGTGTSKTFTVRKISYGVGVEKIFPVHSPNVAGIKVLKSGSARRAKLYYLRNRVGKLALKVKPGSPLLVVEHEEEALEAEQIQPELNPEAEEPTSKEASVDEGVAGESSVEGEIEPMAEETKDA